MAPSETPNGGTSAGIPPPDVQAIQVGQRVEVIGCTVPWVRITSTNPLTGEYAGVRYNLKRSLLGEVLQDAEAPDGQFLTGSAKSSDRQEKAVIAV